MKLTKEEVQQRVLKDGEPLDLKLFNWDVDNRAFESEIASLVIDFTDIDSVKFKTGNSCTFKTGSNCVFNTGSNCKFDTDSDCVFYTDSYCIFNTESDCTFKTSYHCVFNVASNCVFDTGDKCVFKTIDDCTFAAGYGCTFDTGSGCVFYTGNSCIFNTIDNCKFITGTGCTFNTRDNCTFDTDYSCTFDTGSECTFKTSWECVFNTRSKCTFDTDSNCTFVVRGYCKFQTGVNCVIINKSNNEVIKPKPSIKLTTCPAFTPGYLIGTDYYLNNVKQDGAYMVADGTLSKILSKKGNVFKVNNYNTTYCVFNNKATYIVQDGDMFSHGSTIEEARESFIYKISKRDTSVYNNLTLDSVLSKKEAIKMYRVITGACVFGVRKYVESLTDVKDRYTVQEIIELTNGQHGNDVVRKFFKIH